MISVFTYRTKEFDALADVTLPTLQGYCDRHGYDLTVHRGGFGDRKRNYGYQKTEMALQLLDGTEYLWVVDCDVLITNPEVRLEQFVDDRFCMMATHDANGFNAGSYIIRNEPRSKFFLARVIEMEDDERFPGEQDAMRHLLKQPSSDGFLKQLPQNSINSYLYDSYEVRALDGQWMQGDLCLHLPGMTNERRIQIFKSILK